MLGYSLTDKLEKLSKEHDFTFKPVKSELKNIQKLLANRIDAFPCNVDVCLALINTLPDKDSSQITYYDKHYISQHDLYLIVSKQNTNAKEILTRFNAGLKQVQ